MKKMVMPGFIKNLLSVYSAFIFNGIIGIATVPAVVYALGKEQYGIYSIYAILASYIALTDCGVTKHFIRLIAADRSHENQIGCLQKAFGWYVILAIILVITLPLTIYLVCEFLFPVSPDYQGEMRLIVIFAIIEYCLSIPAMISQTLTVANEGFARLSKFNVITGGYRSGMIIIAAFVFRRPSIVVASLIIKRIFDIYCARKIMLWPTDSAVWHPRINFQEYKAILSKSSILAIAQFLQATVIAIGSVLVNRMFGIQVLGNYRAAFDLSGKIWFLSNGIGMLVFPKFSKILANESNWDAIVEKLYGVLKTSWALYLLISLFGILSAKFVLPLIKLDTEQIILFFIILFVGMCINAHSNVSYEFLLAGGRYETVAKLSLVSLVLLLVAFYLLKAAGPYSIAWAWVISQSIYAILADELAIATNRGKENLIKIRLFFPKILILIATFLCLGAEIYCRGAISLSATGMTILSACIYLWSSSPFRPFKKEG